MSVISFFFYNQWSNKLHDQLIIKYENICKILTMLWLLEREREKTLNKQQKNII